MKLTLDNVKAYAIENGYINLRKRDVKGYYLDYTSYRTTEHYYCATLKIVLDVIKNGLALGADTLELDGVPTGLCQLIDQEFVDNYPLNQLSYEQLKHYRGLLYIIDLDICDWHKRREWTEFNRLERLKDYCDKRMYEMKHK